jgi:hypothetical protein
MKNVSIVGNARNPALAKNPSVALAENKYFPANQI